MCSLGLKMGHVSIYGWLVMTQAALYLHCCIASAPFDRCRVKSFPFCRVTLSASVYYLLFNMVPKLFFLYVFATFVAVTTSQKCYGLDGNALDSTYEPCNPSAKHSGCCATKRTNASADICLDNGLCMATHDEQMGMIWQSGCTDATGQDVACPKVCPGSKFCFIYRFYTYL